MIEFYKILLALLCVNYVAQAQEIKNFDQNGEQITRFDELGNAVDAHDGKIAYFNDTYYLYGTSYDCGFEWQNEVARFCGFKSYSSKDMVHWKDEGFLFDAQTPLWQSRCDGKTYGCFRPHVVYNKKNKNYVLWINVYDNVTGYRVFTAKKPTGPFVEVEQPRIEVNKDKPAAGLNNGDHDLFVDDDGTCYLAITDWRTTGTIAIEQLNDDYLSGTGKVATLITSGRTEAPGLFKRKGIYYVTYSDPNCGYCSGTGTSYKTASSPLGPWSEGTKISDNSCGGQPSFVSVMKINSDTIYLYGSDLWNNAARNEALANFYWAPLTFAEDGSINPMDCIKSFVLDKKGEENKVDDQITTNGDYKASCDIGGGIQRSQSFTASSSGTLKSFSITTLKSGYPTADLTLTFYESPDGLTKKGSPLATVVIPQNTLGWSARNITTTPSFDLTLGKRYMVILKSTTNTGCYGFAYSGTVLNADEIASISTDNGENFIPEKNSKLKYNLVIE
ncbi:family 43 glycosylhydrolase [Maribacter polysiphoniae]|uniref:Family 43 glycosylhydrolase n=1 Tax=Maribacter polysiphoniae TaxID=429344 RepID=A0A316EJV2_9FLAO|nr:family 43 glycosylhydrolase [Maribacter polysiphoniae]MBD1259649.1 family 43 glycosylhydrolase [Maribacter polysiphoniae]PWK23210.1 glycosyl hydrolase family 43 [Maribacter polysiphoniae]